MKKKARKQIGFSNRVFHIFNTLFWIVVMLIILYPLYLVCIASVSVSYTHLPNNKYVEIMEVVKSVADTADIMDAKILVSGGRGVCSPENFKILQDLADAVGGTVSCSRAVVDAGWKPKDLQVGQTGKTVRPNVYLSLIHI